MYTCEDLVWMHGEVIEWVRTCPGIIRTLLSAAMRCGACVDIEMRCIISSVPGHERLTQRAAAGGGQAVRLHAQTWAVLQ